MCLAVPGKVLAVDETKGCRVARVEFGGITRSANLELVPEAKEGDYVLVHVGFAISVIDEAEAKRTLDDLRTLVELADELGPDEIEEIAQ